MVIESDGGLAYVIKLLIIILRNERNTEKKKKKTITFNNIKINNNRNIFYIFLREDKTTSACSI